MWICKTAKQSSRRFCHGTRLTWTEGWWVGRAKIWRATGDWWLRVWWGYCSWKSVRFIAFHSSELQEKVHCGDSISGVRCSEEKTSLNNYIDVLWKYDRMVFCYFKKGKKTSLWDSMFSRLGIVTETNFRQCLRDKYVHFIWLFLFYRD